MASGIISMPSYQIIDYSYSYTISANGSLNITATDLGISTPAGYTPIGMAKFGSGNGNVNVRYADAQATGTTIALGLRSVNSSSVSASATFSILYMK